MTTIVRTRVIKIGNSQGIRIPRLLLDQTGLGEEVELELHQDQIVIRAVRHVRHNWEDQFQAMAAKGDDELLDGDALAPTAWDEEEWEW
jgi:antitoxin MazE